MPGVCATHYHFHSILKGAFTNENKVAVRVVDTETSPAASPRPGGTLRIPLVHDETAIPVFHGAKVNKVVNRKECHA